MSDTRHGVTVDLLEAGAGLILAGAIGTLVSPLALVMAAIGGLGFLAPSLTRLHTDQKKALKNAYELPYQGDDISKLVSSLEQPSDVLVCMYVSKKTNKVKCMFLGNGTDNHIAIRTNLKLARRLAADSKVSFCGYKNK